MEAVGELIARIGEEQWSAPTPCTDWSVRQLVNHLVAINLGFASLLRELTPPERGVDHLGADPVGAYRASRAPWAPRPAPSGCKIRLCDLLAHGWDLVQATCQPAELPEDLAEQALAFARSQLPTRPRTGRFAPAQPVATDAPAIERLVAFLGRPVRAGNPPQTV